MKAEFNNATIKIWFSSQHVSRNIYNVTEIIQEENTALVKTSDGDQFLVSMQNVNLIEEIEKK